MAFLSRSLLFVVPGFFFASTALAQTSPKGCPAGQRPSLSGCADGSSQARVRLRADAERKKTTAKTVPKPDPALIPERGTPPLDHQKKALLVRELQQLETMLKRTPEKSPDHPMILRRLAEGYAELEALAERDRARSQAAADDLERAARDAERARRPKKRGQGTIL